MKGSAMQVVDVHGPGDVRLDDVAAPQAGEYDAIIRIEACGICGTDLAYIREGGLPHAPSPMPIGHEAAGTVLAVGQKVNQINVGQRVLVNPMGSSAVIGNGGPEGAFTQQLLVRDAERLLLIVPQEVPSEVAALAEPLAVAQHGVNRSEAMANSHARLVIIAAYRKPVPLDLSTMLMSEMTIKTSMGYPDGLKNVLESLPRLTDKLQHFVSHRPSPILPR